MRLMCINFLNRFIIFTPLYVRQTPEPSGFVGQMPLFKIRVWKGIFGIRDLTKIRYGNRENDKYIDGIRDLTVSREAGLGQNCARVQDLCLRVCRECRFQRPKQINQASAKWCLLSNQTPYGVSGNSLVFICRRPTWDKHCGTCEHSSPTHNLSQALTAGLPAKLS